MGFYLMYNCHKFHIIINIVISYLYIYYYLVLLTILDYIICRIAYNLQLEYIWYCK